jgi:hypothetical protein
MLVCRIFEVRSAVDLCVLHLHYASCFGGFFGLPGILYCKVLLFGDGYFPFWNLEFGLSDLYGLALTGAQDITFL